MKLDSQIMSNVQNFFVKWPVIIEDSNKKTWDLPGLSISLKTDSRKYFVLIKSNTDLCDWRIHFENLSDYPFTDTEKDILFNAVHDIIKPGQVITTEGGVTPGGLSAIKKLQNYGFKKIGMHHNPERLYWATAMIDNNKFDAWLQHADPKDYIVIDKNKDLSIDNTRPVVTVVQRI